MRIPLLLHVDIPSTLRVGFEQAGFSLVTMLRENDRSPILPAGGAPGVKAVLTIGSIGLNASEIAALPDLRVICCQGAGYEKVDLKAAQARGIQVTNGAGTNDTSVADHAMALLASIARNITNLDRGVRHGIWQQARVTRPQLTGKRVGIVGLGNIGQKIAQRCALGFSMTVAYHNRHVRQECDWLYCASVSELAQWADFLIVCTPGGAGTRHMIDRQVLAALGPEGFLVNVARGSVVDTGALIESLQRRTIAGAALDVLEDEPLVPAGLLGLDNIIITPHVGARSPEAQTAMFALVLENLTRCFAGRPLLTPVAELPA
ncbi:2-hydroxyacid dehydrogenase [Acerihabitans sp. TG2]|uniref:2-hydroxyacid dehydrogenase n=1 Tax=Acerihabitans sp. TG2 TaxID=3096008 RepID=UPI002B2390DF|nr:2-hydroxyacid dehydrogenase [Acerihabitans sp. TG2]MEA9392022.1 2-hydroxyacid dehydrogenase [Acerihabitans sp. TG2]